jgi:hypothetical protein
LAKALCAAASPTAIDVSNEGEGGQPIVKVSRKVV